MVDPFASDDKLLTVLRKASTVCVGFAAVVIALGFLRLSWGILTFFVHFEFNPFKATAGDSHEAMSILVGSLEYFLLAPLLYLQLRTLGNFIQTFFVQRLREDTHGKEIRDVLTMKKLSAGLLITMLATHLVGKFLTAHGGTHAEELHVTEATCGAAVMIALIFYLFILEKFGQH